MTRSQRKYLVDVCKYAGDTYNVWFIGDSKEYFRFVDNTGLLYNFDKKSGELTSKQEDPYKIWGKDKKER